MRKLIILFLALPVYACSDLPHDLGDPEHARYVSSGRKDADRKLWWAAVLACQSLTLPIMEENRRDCGTTPACYEQFRVGGFAHMYATMECATGITSFGPGAHPRKEFFDLDKAFIP